MLQENTSSNNRKQGLDSTSHCGNEINNLSSSLPPQLPSFCLNFLPSICSASKSKFASLQVWASLKLSLRLIFIWIFFTVISYPLFPSPKSNIITSSFTITAHILLSLLLVNKKQKKSRAQYKIMVYGVM